jgi:hypothetical protein
MSETKRTVITILIWIIVICLIGLVYSVFIETVNLAIPLFFLFSAVLSAVAILMVATRMESIYRS